MQELYLEGLRDDDAKALAKWLPSAVQVRSIEIFM